MPSFESMRKFRDQEKSSPLSLTEHHKGNIKSIDREGLVNEGVRNSRAYLDDDRGQKISNLILILLLCLYDVTFIIRIREI